MTGVELSLAAHAAEGSEETSGRCRVRGSVPGSGHLLRTVRRGSMGLVNP